MCVRLRLRVCNTCKLKIKCYMIWYCQIICNRFHPLSFPPAVARYLQHILFYFIHFNSNFGFPTNVIRHNIHVEKGVTRELPYFFVAFFSLSLSIRYARRTHTLFLALFPSLHIPLVWYARSLSLPSLSPYPRKNSSSE